MLIRKLLNLAECELKAEGDGGTFEGYASRFGTKDSQGDTILAGAFASTLRQHGKPMMFYQHAWDMPIGKYLSAKEDDSGLLVKGEFTPNHSLANDVMAAMKHGTVTGLSIGGFIKNDDREELEDGTRLIKKFTRLVEISPVVFPAESSARVATVKAEDMADALEGVETIRDFERFLRDAGGLGRGLATALSARAKVIFAQGEPVTKAADAERAALVERLLKLANGIK